MSKLIYDENVNEDVNELNQNFSTSNDRLNTEAASIATKNRIKLFTTKLLSSGADTGSDTSDTELRSITNTKEMKDFDWNRSASSSSRSRSKSSRHASNINYNNNNNNNNNNNLVVLNEQQRIRPVSISSDTNNREESSSLKHICLCRLLIQMIICQLI